MMVPPRGALGMRRIFTSNVALSLADQGLLSAANFLINIWLIRVGGPTEFGKFVFVSATYLIFSSIQSALVGTPISVFVSPLTAEKRICVESTLIDFDFFFRTLGTLGALAICMAADASSTFLIAAGCYVITMLWRETCRSVHFARHTAFSVLSLDATSIMVGLAATASLWPFMPSAAAPLFGLAIGNGVALVVDRGQVALRWPRGVCATLMAYRPYWHEARWALVGATTTIAQTRSYVFAVQALRGADVLGMLQAGNALLGPLGLVVGAWGRVSRPDMSRLLACGEKQSAQRLLKIGLGFILCLDLVFFLFLFLLWHWIEPLLFAGKYPEIGTLTAAWGIYTILTHARSAVGIYLGATLRFRSLAFSTVVGAMVSIGILALLFYDVPSIVGIASLIGGEFVALGLNLRLLVRAWKS